MTETKPKRRWFRFSLRTLLTVVAIAAVASWGYWVGWPWWQAYREQVGFEAAVRQLKAGVTTELAEDQIPRQSHDSAILYSGSSGWTCTITQHFRRNANYCIYYMYPESSMGSSGTFRVLVFRYIACRAPPRLPGAARPSLRSEARNK